MAYNGPIVDVDVHHRWKTDLDVIAYLPKEWRDYFAGDGKSRPTLAPPGTAAGVTLTAGGKRVDARPPDGNPPGSSYEMLRSQLLDKYNYHRAVLTYDTGHESTHRNQYLAVALCSAINDWSIDNWLDLDERIYSVILVAGHVPEAAVAEIRRIGRHPRMVGVLMPSNPLGRSFGDPLYHPIYEAAAEFGLAIAYHPGSADAPLIKMVGGTTSTFIESNLQFPAQAAHYISSLIFHGVFEKYPTLTVMIKEFGLSWLPNLIWKLDENYDVLRMDSPWVKRWPSEYVHDHIKLSTQPIEASARNASAWVDLVATVDGIDDILCFSSDYPHYSFDDPHHIGRLLPTAWVRKIFYENACRTYGWQFPAGVEEQPAQIT